MSVDERAYPSKVDTWLAVILFLAVVFPPIMVGIVALSTHQAFLIPAGFISTVMVCMLAIPVRYVLLEKELLIQSGMIRIRVPYDSIERVEPSRNPLSSPALSLDRLAITHVKGSVMVSPADREGFLSDLQGRARLRRHGDTLSRYG